MEYQDNHCTVLDRFLYRKKSVWVKKETRKILSYLCVLEGEQLELMKSQNPDAWVPTSIVYCKLSLASSEELTVISSRPADQRRI